MVAISRDDRRAACISPNRLESSGLRHPDSDAAFDCMQAPPALDYGAEALSSRSRYQNCSVA